MKISDFDAGFYADHFYIVFVTWRLVFKEENKEKVKIFYKLMKIQISNT